jgi:hypothetical protein
MIWLNLMPILVLIQKLRLKQRDLLTSLMEAFITKMDQDISQMEIKYLASIIG